MIIQHITVEVVHLPSTENNVTAYEDSGIVKDAPKWTLFSSDIVTLSSHGTGGGGSLFGLIYVPALDPSSSCIDEMRPHVPINATKALMPYSDRFAYIALAPWLSDSCNLELLRSAQKQPTTAFIFYRPTPDGSLPSSTDSSWGNVWSEHNPWPVLAISSSDGQVWVDKTANYVAEVPRRSSGGAVSPHTKDVFRLQADIEIGTNIDIPNLWDFLLITGAVLAGIIGSISFLMHCLQRYRRHSLRRRVAQGEVDLEQLGIKGLTVPKDLLDKMPVYTFEESTVKELQQEIKPVLDVADVPQITIVNPKDSATDLQSDVAKPAYSQLTCAICLDDFKVNETRIREMPCKHIFHPECIDDFLLKTSSLCPLCKTSVLPKGYCPALITNSMVRRDRIIRAGRVQRARQSVGSIELSQILNRRMSRAHEQNAAPPSRRIGDMIGDHSVPTLDDPPVRTTRDSAISIVETTNAQTLQIPSASRSREWRRQNALVLLGQDSLPTAVSRPLDRPGLVRRAWTFVFPGFR